MGPDGNVIYVPRNQAAGMSPPGKTSKDPRLYVLSEDMSRAAHIRDRRGSARDEPRQGRERARRPALEADAEKAIDENTGYLSTDTADLGGTREAYKVNWIQVKREMPSATQAELHAEAKSRTAGKGGGELRRGGRDALRCRR